MDRDEMLAKLLKEARQYVSDAGSDEDGETRRLSNELLEQIDAALRAQAESKPHLETWRKALKEIEELGRRSHCDGSFAIRMGNIAHAALLAAQSADTPNTGQRQDGAIDDGAYTDDPRLARPMTAAEREAWAALPQSGSEKPDHRTTAEPDQRYGHRSLEDAARPGAFLAWARHIFGPVALVRGERLLRFIEEALELAHADGMERATLNAVADRVYSREPGEVNKEIGQAQACLETYAKNIGECSAALAEAEWQRVQSIPKDEWERRHAAKQKIGIALPASAVSDHQLTASSSPQEVVPKIQSGSEASGAADTRPYFICAACKGNGYRCEKCGGIGFVPGLPSPPKCSELRLIAQDLRDNYPAVDVTNTIFSADFAGTYCCVIPQERVLEIISALSRESSGDAA